PPRCRPAEPTAATHEPHTHTASPVPPRHGRPSAPHQSADAQPPSTPPNQCDYPPPSAPAHQRVRPTTGSPSPRAARQRSDFHEPHARTPTGPQAGEWSPNQTGGTSPTTESSAGQPSRN